MKRLLHLALFLLLATAARAAIGFNATTNAQSAAAASSLTYSHTCSGAERLLFVGVSWKGSSGVTVSSVTYAGIGMTSIRSDQSAAPPNWTSHIFYLIGPATGANNVVVTMSGAVPAGTVIVSGAISLTGVDQTTALDAHNGAIGNSTTPSVSVTTVADNAWVLDTMTSGFDATVPVAGGGQTARWSIAPSPAADPDSAGSTKGPVTPPAATTMSWTLNAVSRWAISAASFKPSGGAPAAPKRLLLMGVG